MTVLLFLLACATPGELPKPEAAEVPAEVPAAPELAGLWMEEDGRDLLWLRGDKCGTDTVEQWLDDTDLMLRPPVQDFGLLDFGRMDEIRQVALRYTKAQFTGGRRSVAQFTAALP